MLTGPRGRTFSRRSVLRAGALAGAALTARGRWPGLVEADVTQATPLATGVYALNAQWLFAPYTSGAEAPAAPETGMTPVTLPHTAVPLGWGNWDPTSWQRQWLYRTHLSGAAISGGRAFVDFQGVMTGATVFLNGSSLGSHQGGYLPFSVELTGAVIAGDNVLAVEVDGTLLNTPPNNPNAGPQAIDFLQPAGIYREATLRIVPEVFVADVFALPTGVLTPSPALELTVTLDVGELPASALGVSATLSDASGHVVATAATGTVPEATGPVEVPLTLAGLTGISLWSPESPTLYEVAVTVTAPGGAAHTFTTRTGFRDAEFRVDGFYLNGTRCQLFGLNRHQLFPYTGMAATARLQRRDAELLRTELNCNMVRCSHYPQSPWFLDACDELGLMVWQEPPGWQYVGDATFQQRVLENVHDMILRDRNRPSVITWAVRLNETPSVPNQALYAQTDALAATLDGSRQTTGAIDGDSALGWNQQVFALDDYLPLDGNGNAQLLPPIGVGFGQLPSVPYMVSETVGAVSGSPTYRWLDRETALQQHAHLHSQVHAIAAANPGFAGVLAWAGIDYATLTGGGRVWATQKTCGVLDTFRTAKPGAAAYQGQPASGAPPMIVPAFFWDASDPLPTLGSSSVPQGLIATNCEQIQLLDAHAPDVPFATGTPNLNLYQGLAYPPVTVGFGGRTGASTPELLIQGLIGGKVVTTVQMSADTTADQLQLTVDDTAIVADGSDATRFTLRATDRYGNHRPHPTGDVTLALSGPATLIAQAPLQFDLYGGVGGGFLRSQAGATGTITLTATHPTLAPSGVSVQVQAQAGQQPAAPAGSGVARVLNPEPVIGASVPVTAAAPGTARIRKALQRAMRPRGRQARISQLLRGGERLTFEAPAAGELVIGWYAALPAPRHRPSLRRLALVAVVRAEIRHAGRVRVTLRVTGRGRALLRHSSRVVLLADASFTPRGGTPVSVSGPIELHG